jgi:SpoVK/Ycf46/Vps4 family AAA+-type ATPase
VLGDWGFAARPGVHAGVSALFAGPPGTGKTMAAEVVARELGLDLYAIDLSRVASKYVGDTEKNLDGIFAAAEQSNAILLFDEADALFGKRSEVRDSHDRYANLEVSFLLQRFDAHPGVSILATNMREHLDDAFSRRLTFVIDFPFPDADERLRLWERAWPPGVPRAQEMDASRLAGRFALTGGEITNVALAAAFLAAASGKALDEDHVRRALLREQLKTGRGVPAPLDQPDRPEGTGS